MTPRRFANPPEPQLSPRTSSNSDTYPRVDSILKQLRTCTRRLQTVLSLHRDEIQILERLYYKGKNQHRTALFWKRVAEVRRYGDRLDGMGIFHLMESLRLSFWGHPSQRTSRVLKGPWTHYPDAKFIRFVLERCSACCMLVHKATERLSAAYHSFTLMMQTGAFLQHILTLVAITSRLSALFTETGKSTQISWQASFDLLQILDPNQARSVNPLIVDDAISAESHIMAMDAMTLQATQIQGTIEEDLGSALQRPLSPHSLASSKTSLAPIIVSSEVQNLDIASDLMIAPLAVEQATIERKTVVMTSSTKESTKKRKDADEKAAKHKKKKKRDEIDDIFGF